jgi:fumarylpyruvate hydrolase
MQSIPEIPTPALEIHGSNARFPVRRIYCVGRNYAEHAREMGHDPDREPPFFFSKPADTVVGDGATLPYPPQTQNLHYEAELVVALGSGGRDIAVEHALDHVWGYACGNDLTRRDLQAQAKKLGRPWDLAKGFDRSAPIGALHPVAQTGHLDGAQIALHVNDTLRQSGSLDQMIWSVAEVISILSQSVELSAGDLIMTGTPAGVGALNPGDHCRVEITGLSPLSTKIAPVSG